MKRRNILAIALGGLFLVSGKVQICAAEEPLNTMVCSVAGDLQTTGKAQNRAQSCPPEGCDPEPSGFSCRDTDGGRRSGERGTVTLYYYGSYVASYTDYCSSNEWLVEHWCTSTGSWTTTNYLCEYGCSEGRCLFDLG